jgi:hypothetical protein
MKIEIEIKLLYHNLPRILMELYATHFKQLKIKQRILWNKNSMIVNKLLINS